MLSLRFPNVGVHSVFGSRTSNVPDLPFGFCLRKVGAREALQHPDDTVLRRLTCSVFDIRHYNAIVVVRKKLSK